MPEPEPDLKLVPILLIAILTVLPSNAMSQSEERPRIRDLGVEVGIFETGRWNAITDVEGLTVGHTTVVEDDRVNTGVTAIRQHGGSAYHERVPAAIHVGNGYGKLIGSTQVRELGELETPILLTCTLCVWRAADALVEWVLGQPGMEEVWSLNAVVGETNDRRLNDIRARPIRPEHVVHALESASSGPVEEGSVGAGRGTSAFGWKGGIGTSSRVLPEPLGGHTVGVLVQSNFGGILTMAGAPVGRELEQYSFREEVEGTSGQPEGDGSTEQEDGSGSIMIVVATDAPLSSRNLERLAKRAIMGLARTGSFAGNSSGDYVIAFSTAESVRRRHDEPMHEVRDLANDEMSALFQAVVEATEESVYNSLLKATTVTGMGVTVEAINVDAVLTVLHRHGVGR
jgi:D-aminopeptidase